MRKVILKQKVREGGRLFELGSLVVKQDEIPVQFGFDFAKPNFAGYARDMRLDVETGEVSMEINLGHGYSWDQFPDGLFDFTIFATEVEARGSAHLNTQVVSRCTLRAVVIVPIHAMPSFKPEAKK